jgi:hypothetical protein
MTRNKKTKRTQIKDLTAAEQELTGKEMKQVQGGASNLNLSKSNINRLAPDPGSGSQQTNASSLSAHEVAHIVQQGGSPK